MFIPERCLADTFVLKNGKRLEGSLKSLENGVYTAVVEGKEIRFPQEDMIRIESDLPLEPDYKKPSEPISKYATPKQTFHIWRKAAVEGNIQGMVDCYVSYQQKAVKKDLKKIRRKKRKEMAEVAGRTDFSTTEPYYQGDRATMEVTWRAGLQSDVQVLQFALENGEWKLIQL